MANNLVEKLSAERQRGPAAPKANTHILRDLNAEVEAFVEERSPRQNRDEEKANADDVAHSLDPQR